MVMASSGGGKIKSKRPRGAKKPYQRPKSILSQVTETVTGLVVPSWLKNVWSGNAQEPEEEPHEPSSPEFDPDVPSTSYGTGNPPNQRRLLQNPDAETPSGSLLANRQREGHEPKGIRNQISQGTPLPFSAYTHPIQTSTPVENEFIPPHRDVKISERDDDTDSSVSTSGCSSLLPHVDRADHKEKLAQSNLDQLSERSQSSHNTPSRMSLWSDTNTFNTSQSIRGSRQSESKPQPAAKRPRFNATYFGTPRQITTPVTGEKHKSAFYPGRTTFGGSSFYRSPAKKQYNPSPYQVHLPVRRHIRPKPAAQSTMDPDFGVTSNTAMKILNTLDRMSTPLSDAKRIPLTPTPSPFAFNRRRSYLPEKKSGPPVSGIQVGDQARLMSNVQPPPPPPSSATGPTESSDKDTSSSQNLTAFSRESVTRIPSPSVTFLNTDMSKNTPTQGMTVPRSPPKSGGKMKSKSRNSLHYSASREEDEILDVPDLPEVALPLSSNAMPTFNFGGLQSNSSVTKLPTPVSTVNGSHTLHLDNPVKGNKVKGSSNVTTTPDVTASSFTKDETIPKSVDTRNVNKPLMTSTPFPGSKPAPQFQFSSSGGKSDGSVFKFSVPAVKSSSAGDNALPTVSAGEFTFSAPKVKESSQKVSSGFSFTKSSPVKENITKEETDEEPSSGGIKVATMLKSGSCLQVFASAQAKPSSADVTSKTTTGSFSFMDKFKSAPGSWECGTCLVRNDKNNLKCVACQSEKPREAEPSNTLQSSSGFSLADKFKPEAGSWECGICLVRNKADKTKCEACQTSKPSTSGGISATAPSSENKMLTFGDKFKPAEGSWECDTCMVQNTSTSTNCVACQTKKPGALLQSSSVGGGFGDKFKPASGSWTCDTCLVQNQATDSKCLACQTSKPGSSQVSSNSGGFSIPESALKTNKSSQILFGSKPVNDGSKVKTDSSNKPSLLDLFKVEAGTWDCDTCMVQNKPASTTCAACETPKPGSQPTLSAPPASTFKFGSSVTSTESATSSSTGGFKFDGTMPSFSSGTTSSMGGFQFSSGATSENAEGSNGGVMIPKSLQGFSFGLPKNSTLDSSSTSQASSVAVSSSVGFSLGASKDMQPSGGTSLQVSKGNETSAEGSKVTDNVKPVNTGFRFGDKAEDTSSKKTLAFTFGASSKSQTPDTGTLGSAPDFVVGTKEATDKGVVSTSHKPLGFQFGSNSNATLSSSQVAPNASPFQSSAPSSTDSQPAIAAQSVNPLSTASTGSASVTNQSSTSSFFTTTTASKISEPSANSATFQFGSSLNSASSSLSSQSAVPPGKRKEAEPSSTSTDNEVLKPTFNFVGASPAGVNFGSSATKEQQSVSLFGTAKKANLGNQQQNPSPFQFGAASTSSSAAAPVNKSIFTFGPSSQQSQQAPSSNTSGFQFGTVSSSSQNSQGTEKPFTFGAPPTSMQSSVGSFTGSKTLTGFDVAGTASSTSDVPSFGGFGTNAAAPNTSGSIFGNLQPQQNAAPAFGQGGTQQNSFGTPANSVPAFGSSNPSPAFGSSTSGFGGSSNPVNTNNSGFQSESKSLTFSFGQNNNNTPSGVFPFSGASNPQPTNNSQSGFQFNASQPPSFNFGAASANTQSAFQFGANQSNASNPFNASAPPSGRRIRKAVRRTGKKT